MAHDTPARSRRVWPLCTKTGAALSHTNRIGLMGHFAIFDTGDFDKDTDHIQYVTDADSPEEAFEAFTEDILSNTGEEDGWTWHVYPIPEPMSDSEIYAHVADRSPTVMKS